MLVEPQTLFDRHLAQADRVAERLCWSYRVSGALTYQEEARSEARLALWRCCLSYNPDLQAFQKKLAHVADLIIFWSPVLGIAVTEPRKDPYASFWIWAVQRVGGRVLDFFRSQHLITRLAPGETHTMLYRERFVSMGTPKGQTARGSSNPSLRDEYLSQDYTDSFFSSDRADTYNELESIQLEISTIMSDAHLTQTEQQAIDLAYGDEEMEPAEIAEMMGIGTATAKLLLKTALGKLQDAAHSLCNGYGRSALSHASATKSITLPMLQP